MVMLPHHPYMPIDMSQVYLTDENYSFTFHIHAGTVIFDLGQQLFTQAGALASCLGRVSGYGYSHIDMTMTCYTVASEIFCTRHKAEQFLSNFQLAVARHMRCFSGVGGLQTEFLYASGSGGVNFRQVFAFGSVL